MKVFQIGCAALLALCLSVAGAAYWIETQPSAPQPNFTVDPTEIDWPGASGGEHELILAITNPASVPRRILGSATGCGKNCCFGSKHEIVRVGAGETFEYHIRLVIKDEGEFSARIKIYLEENGIRTVTLHVTGTAVEAPRAPK